MKSLPLFYYPSCWVWVDDDSILLRSMALTFGKQNKVTPFLSSKDCLEFLKTYESPLSQQSFLKSNIEDENYGMLQSTPVDFDVTSLAKLASNPKRHEEITVMVIDYNMPEMNGFALAEATKHLPFKKILLTGNAQESAAIKAFNNNLINRFVQKTENDMFAKLTAYLIELSIQYFADITHPLLSYLETESPLPLSDAGFINFFETFRKEHKITEYYLIDKQGSFLCIDQKGDRLLLAVQTAHNLDAWLKIYANNSSLPEIELKALREHKKIPFFGIGTEAWQLDSSEWVEHLYPASTFESRDFYLWSIVKEAK